MWPQYKPEHLFYFSRGAVAEMARQANLSTVVLESLSKSLPVGYFLSVGSNFGPAPVRSLSKLVRAMTPSILRRVQIPLRLGEWLWVARYVKRD
jgi:hypothetical protein